MTCAASIDDSRTFHSRPSKSAVCERFDEPTNAVVSPDARSSSHAFAWSLVVRASNATRTSAPSATSSSTARFSVAPMYVVVITRTSPAARLTLRKRLAEVAHARPDHERADQVDRVRGRQLGAQLGADVRLALRVDQQVALAERRRRQRRQRHDVTERRPALIP